MRVKRIVIILICILNIYIYKSAWATCEQEYEQGEMMGYNIHNKTVEEYCGVTDDQAIRAIIGEALHDEESMRYMAHAMRNRIAIRGDLRGVYGKDVRLDDVDGSLWQRAAKAWFNSESEEDVTQGADHWLSDYDLTHCRPERMSWRFKMRETAYKGQTHFYKEVGV